MTCWYCREQITTPAGLDHGIHRACYAEKMDRKFYGEEFATPILDAAEAREMAEENA